MGHQLKFIESLRYSILGANKIEDIQAFFQIEDGSKRVSQSPFQVEDIVVARVALKLVFLQFLTVNLAISSI